MIRSLRTGRDRRDPKGQIIVLFALALIVMLAFAAIVIDVGVLRNNRQTLVNAMDSAALAGGTLLPVNGVAEANTAQALIVANVNVNYNGLALGTGYTITYKCLIGYDTTLTPALQIIRDIPITCDPHFSLGHAPTAADFHGAGTTRFSSCNPFVGDKCNVVEVAGSVTTAYSFGRVVGVNSGSTGTVTSVACNGPCGQPPLKPLDVALVIDRTGSMAGDEANLRNAAGAVLQAYDPAIQHVALGMLGPSDENTPCASGGYGEPFVNPTLTAPTYMSSSLPAANAITGATTIVVVKPNGAVVGDLLVAGISFDGGSGIATVTPPAGWTIINRSNSAANVGLATYYRVVAAGEPANYTWTFSSSTRASGGIMRFGNADTANPIDGVPTVASGANGTTATATSVNTTTNETTLVGFFSADTNTAFTPSGGQQLTERFDVTNPSATGPTTEGSTRVQNNAGNSGNKTASLASAPWVAQLIALRAAPVVTYNTAFPVTPYPASLAKWIPVGLTGTSNAPVLESYLNANGTLNNASAIVKTINCVQPGHLYNGTDLATPMDFAWKYLRDNARAGVKTGIIFETDGTPQTQNYTCAQATTAANAAKAAGVEVFMIGFSLEASGGNSAPTCPDQPGRTALTQLASMATNSASVNTTRCDPNENTDGDHFFCEPTGADLTAVFRAAAEQLAGLKTHLISPYPVPVVSSVSPGAGSAGTTITIGGQYFTGTTSVLVGGTAVAFTVLSDSSIRVTAPAGTSGQTVDITVTTPGGTSPAVNADHFRYN